MLDPRFANAGAAPLIPGYGAQPMSVSHHRHHRHHRKHKHGVIGESPLSRDESIHKVDHGHHHHQLQENSSVPLGTGYGVAYGVSGNYPQQLYPSSHHGVRSQYQGNTRDQGQFGVAAVTKHRRRHHRHHRKQATGAPDTNEVAEAVPDILIGQRSSSALGNQASNERQERSSVSPGADEATEQHKSERKSRRHHRSAEHFSVGGIYHSRQVQGQVSGGAEEYGHIDKDLIFIERGEDSPHRQQPPADYEFKGKIEVQCVDKEHRSQSRGRISVNQLPLQPPSVPPQTNIPISNIGPCPPGWQQAVLSAAPGGPCPPGANMYTGQLVGGAGLVQTGFSGVGGVGSAGSYGAGSSGSGLANLAACLPFPPDGQLIADYIVEASTSSGGQSTSGGFTDQQGQHGSYQYNTHSSEVVDETSSRVKIIEVWQKRAKTSEKPKNLSNPSSPSNPESPEPDVPEPSNSIDFDKFRSEILEAIKQVMQNGGKTNPGGQSGGTQTTIHQGISGESGQKHEVISSGGSSSGEVRVIVQPIQPVFYMPRAEGEQSSESSNTQPIGPAPPGPAPPGPQNRGGAPQIVYVPRNVYVPVIKPVFVPRERVIVRPQVIHVARPVLVDRPVPVTQRPIIIDRERPIPVPVRGQEAAQTGESKVIREEYVYRDNLPVAYGGRCPEFAGGVNYGYMPTQQEHQYASSSVHEVSNPFPPQGSVIDVAVPNQFEHSQSNGQLNAPHDSGSFHQSFVDVGQVDSASGFNGVPPNCTAPIEVLDATVNPAWQRTDKATLVRRFGRPAFDLVQQTDQVEQQMYRELRQRSSSGGVQRSYSSASYGSGSGVAQATVEGFGAANASFSSFSVGNLQCD